MVAVGNKAREDTVGGRSDQRGHTADGGRVGNREEDDYTKVFFVRRDFRTFLC